MRLNEYSLIPGGTGKETLEFEEVWSFSEFEEGESALKKFAARKT